MSDNIETVPSVEIDGVAMHSVSPSQTVQIVMGELDEGRGGLLLTANVDIMFQLRKRGQADIARKARLVVADGMPLVWASHIQGTPIPGRVTGADLVWHLSEAAAARGRKVFLLGAGPGVAEAAGRTFVATHPGLQICGTECPPIGFDKDPDYMAGLVDRLRQAQPDLVFVALGFPKQERVALALLEHLSSTWFMGCGGALDMAAGEVARAHPLLQRAGVEWLHRLGLEPRRLARRYLVDDVPFALQMVGRAIVGRVKKQG